jgi:hypothetical protein
MYRHFAALTLVISLTVALFANGGQNVAHGEPPKPAKTEKKAPTQRSEMDVLNGASSPSTDGKNASSAPPTLPPSSGGDEGAIEPVSADGGQSNARGSGFRFRRPSPQVDSAALARMTPAQRLGYVNGIASPSQLSAMAPVGGNGPGGAGRAGSGGPTQQQMDRLVSASRARSGGGD